MDPKTLDKIIDFLAVSIIGLISNAIAIQLEGYSCFWNGVFTLINAAMIVWSAVIVFRIVQLK